MSRRGWLARIRQVVQEQQAALAKLHPWNELNASLHATTVMSLKSGETRLCKLCREPDHAESQCALASFQAHLQPALALPPLPPASKRVTRPETLERIYTSWNKGRCAFPGSCRFRHVCAMCRRKGHWAKDCEDTAADSPTRWCRVGQPPLTPRHKGVRLQGTADSRVYKPRPLGTRVRDHALFAEMRMRISMCHMI